MLSELEKAIEEFNQIQENLKKHPVADQFRVYYDTEGKIVKLDVGPPWEDLPYAHIDVTADQWKKIDSLTKVENGSLVFFDSQAISVLQLIENEQGEHVTVKDHMSLYLEPGEEYNDVTRYKKNVS
jgi:hypothetical protein